MKLSNYDLKAANGEAGCLAIFWNEKLDVKILETNKWYIHCVIKGKSGLEWFALFKARPTEKRVFGIN